MEFPAGFNSAIASLPSGTPLTDAVIVTARDTDGYATDADLYYSDGYIKPMSCYVCPDTGWENIQYQSWARNLETITLKNRITRLGKSAFCGTKNLQAISSAIDQNPFEHVTAIDLSITWNRGAFAYCAGVTSLSFPSYVNKENYGSVTLTGFCYSAPNLESISMPGVSGWLHQGFCTNCTSLKTAYFPKLTGLNADHNSSRGVFAGCTALETVELGSVGYGLTMLENHNFYGCTQSGLTITFYIKNGANVDTYLTNVRNGATNATIIIKASEATTYGGVSYAAGDTILTSNP
jgi:hypothetical protein